MYIFFLFSRFEISHVKFHLHYLFVDISFFYSPEANTRQGIQPCAGPPKQAPSYHATTSSALTPEFLFSTASIMRVSRRKTDFLPFTFLSVLPPDTILSLRSLSTEMNSNKTLNLPSLLPKPKAEAAAFHLFPNLAPELRLKIWAHACFHRTVSIWYLPSLDVCLSSSPTPVILHVSREAREEALRTYSLAFGTRSSPARTYFNPYRDTLYLPRHMAMGYDETLRDFKSLVLDPTHLLDQVRRIAIDHVDVEVKRPWESYNKASLIRRFKNLDEVVLVLCQKGGGREEGWRKETVFVDPREAVEEVLRFWFEFRQTFLLEERRLEEVCMEVGREYERFSLPTVKIRDKLLM